MFHAGSVPRIKSKRTLVMNETDVHGAVLSADSSSPRKSFSMLLQPSYKAVRTLDGEHFALAWGGPYVNSDNAVEIRTIYKLVDCISGLFSPQCILRGGGSSPAARCVAAKTPRLSSSISTSEVTSPNCPWRRLTRRQAAGSCLGHLGVTTTSRAAPSSTRRCRRSFPKPCRHYRC